MALVLNLTLLISNPQGFGDLQSGAFLQTRFCWITGRLAKAAGALRTHSKQHTFLLALEHLWLILDVVMGSFLGSRSEREGEMDEARGKMESDGGALFVFCP